jgi:putative nucleotidyltransferase with HDIG domain
VSWRRSLPLGALVVFVAVASSWLLTPAGSGQRMPGVDALGTPAVGTFKAARDFEVRDDAATERVRAQAVAAVRSVYDFDEGALEDAASRVRTSFREQRPDERRGARGPRLDAAQLADARARFEASLGAAVSREDHAALHAAGFSTEVEEALVALAARALSGMVVADGAALAAEGDKGIVVRTVRRGEVQGEHSVLDVGVVRDATSARQDLARSEAALPAGWAPHLRGALVRVAKGLVRPTLVANEGETAARRRVAAASVKPVLIQVKRGEKIVGDGEPIEERHLAVFRGIERQTRRIDVLLVRAGGAALVGLLVLLLWRYARRNLPAFRPGRKDALLLALTLLGTLGLAAVGLAVGDALHDRFSAIPPEAFYYLVPFAAGAMVVRSVLSAELALLFSVAAGVGVGLLAGNSLFVALHAMLTSVAASGLVARTRDRAGLFRVGAAVGALGAMLVVATTLFTGRALGDALAPAASALLTGALLLPVLVVGILPLVEWSFGYVTDLKLLELANLNHPALKDLIVKAPGTYHHSVIMASLVEAAAEEIGANSLLARVCAYYHDIGKCRNPVYFAENQRGENRHDGMAASMSALIVKRHVTDGMELARHWRLPQVVADAIPQHHGTRLVSFFWAKAMRAAEDGADAAGESPLDEEMFRYPGPKPQTRETALVMIADACEASARAMPDPTPQNLEALVHRRINEIFGEGQLDECALTLKDLKAIANAMVRALDAVYHGRPEYPGRPAQPPAGAAGPQLQLVVKS